MTREKFLKKMEEIKAREEALPEAEWKLYTTRQFLTEGPYGREVDVYSIPGIPLAARDPSRSVVRSLDFIAASRTDLPALREALSIAVEALTELGSKTQPNLGMPWDSYAREALDRIYKCVGGGE